MAVPAHNMAEQIIQLNAARNLVLGDANFYGQIVEGILPIIGASARLELRRWGADFLAETFASPTLALAQKQKLSLLVLPTLKDLLEVPAEDPSVVKSVVQASASLYPIVFRHIIDHPEENWVWEKMSEIKLNILRRWDSSSPVGIRICCVRFVQRVVQVQTAGPINDPRRPEANETSLALVPRNHPLIPPSNLEPEASGLLDRLLSVFQENSSDAIMIDATLNGLSALIRTRPTIAQKIITAVLNFNPLKQANSPMTPRIRVIVKSIERTTRAFMININKRNPGGPLAGKIHQYIERLIQSRTEIFEETNRKRPAPGEIDGEHSKRARLAAPVKPIPPLPPGPTSYAQLFTLTDDVGLSSFDVQQLPIDLVTKIAAPILARIDQSSLDEAINAIRSRYLTIQREQHMAPAIGAPTGVDDDDDDYEPDYQPSTEDAEQILNKIEAEGTDEVFLRPEIALGPFKLPQPPPLSAEGTALAGRNTVNRVLSMVGSVEDPSNVPKQPQRLGLNRLAGSNFDKDAWITVISRLATRPSPESEAAEDEPSAIKQEAKLAKKAFLSVPNSIRESLYLYILEDFRRRIGIAIAWLNEEWFSKQLAQTKQIPTPMSDSPPPSPYETYLHKLLTSIIPYLDARLDTKLLIRFLSEIPSLSADVLSVVATLARDPERVGLCVAALHYIVLMRPPAREIALDTLEEIYNEEDGARKASAKVLGKWRPAVLDVPAETAQPVNGIMKEEGNQMNESGDVTSGTVVAAVTG